MHGLEQLRKRLAGYKKEDIVITNHAELQAFVRDVDLDEVKNNITSPKKLVYAKKQDSINDQEKYDCYFAYSKHLYHRYILLLNGKVIIVTIIKVNRDWQKAIEKK